jgi:hypothetical protein
MGARDIHFAAEELLGDRIRWSSVKGTLASHASGARPRFSRVGPGAVSDAGRLNDEALES